MIWNKTLWCRQAEDGRLWLHLLRDGASVWKQKQITPFHNNPVHDLCDFCANSGVFFLAGAWTREVVSTAVINNVTVTQPAEGWVCQPTTVQSGKIRTHVQLWKTSMQYSRLTVWLCSCRSQDFIITVEMQTWNAVAERSMDVDEGCSDCSFILPYCSIIPLYYI